MSGSDSSAADDSGPLVCCTVLLADCSHVKECSAFIFRVEQSRTAVLHCSPALQSRTAVPHCSPALQSCTAVPHCSPECRQLFTQWHSITSQMTWYLKSADYVYVCVSRKDNSESGHKEVWMWYRRVGDTTVDLVWIGCKDVTWIMIQDCVMLSGDSLQFRCFDALPVGSSSKPIDLSWTEGGGGETNSNTFSPTFFKQETRKLTNML